MQTPFCRVQKCRPNLQSPPADLRKFRDPPDSRTKCGKTELRRSADLLCKSGLQVWSAPPARVINIPTGTSEVETTQHPFPSSIPNPRGNHIRHRENPKTLNHNPTPPPNPERRCLRPPTNPARSKTRRPDYPCQPNQEGEPPRLHMKTSDPTGYPATTTLHRGRRHPTPWKPHLEH